MPFFRQAVKKNIPTKNTEYENKQPIKVALILLRQFFCILRKLQGINQFIDVSV